MTSRDDLYSLNLFLNSVIPLLKVVVQGTDKLQKRFKDLDGIIQISANRKPSEGGKVATHFILDGGNWEVKKSVNESPHVELEFKSVQHLNDFFKSKTKKLPKIRGFRNLKLLVSTFAVLLKLSALLGNTDVPEDKKEAELLTKMYFYLLSSGISQLNKLQHPEVSKWVKKSPDRVYAWRVDKEEDISAYIRVKAGKSKSSRGIYRRAKPFFTMYFDSVESALGILLEKDNLLESTSTGKLTMMGAPEYGAQIGEYMAIVGSYVK